YHFGILAQKSCSSHCVENSIGALRLSSGRTVKYLILLTPRPVRAEALEAWTGFHTVLWCRRNTNHDHDPRRSLYFFQTASMKPLLSSSWMKLESTTAVGSKVLALGSRSSSVLSMNSIPFMLTYGTRS